MWRTCYVNQTLAKRVGRVAPKKHRNHIYWIFFVTPLLATKWQSGWWNIQQSRLSQEFLWQSVSNPWKKPSFTSGRSILLMVPKFSIEDFIKIDFHIHHDRWWWPDFCQLIIWLVIAQLPIGKTLPPSFSLEVVLFAAGTPDHKHKGSPGFCWPQRNPRDGLFPKQLEKQHRTLLSGRKRCGSNLVGTWEVTQVAYPFPTRVFPPEKPMSTCLPFTFSSLTLQVVDVQHLEMLKGPDGVMVPLHF